MQLQIRTEVDSDGVLVATIDMPGRTMNVFSAELMDALDALMDRVEADPAVRSVVLTSGKSSFLAGADLAMVRGFTESAQTATPEQLFELCGRLGRQFVRLEACPKPWVAALNGLALGGGLELALACRRRLAADSPRVQLGVPEVKLGLLPGAGGTQRLPRLAPFEPAMELLLTGRPIAPARALELGIVDDVYPAAQLLDAAKAAARSMHGQPYDARAKFGRYDEPDVPAPGSVEVREIAARHGIDAARFARYPAYAAICDAVLEGARLPLAEATAVEMRNFLRLMYDPVAGQMIRALFLERLRAERELAPPADLKIVALKAGAIGPARAAWAPLLDKLALPPGDGAAPPADTVDLTDSRGGHHRLALRVLDEPASESEWPQAVLAPPAEFGRVVEIVAARGGPSDAALAAFASRIGALPWRTPGPRSLLQRLRGLPLPEQAQLARTFAGQPGAGDPAFVDVAACLSGVTPAWSGGPLSWKDGEHAA